MATLTFTSSVDLDGKELLDDDASTSRTLTVTGDMHRAVKTLAAAGFDNIWTTGDGGLANFDVCIIEVSDACWVELRNDHSGGAEFALIEVTEDNPLILTSDSMGTSAATQVDGVAFAANTEYGLIDAINVQNDGASSITVKLTLVD